jgi:hypothetical protein
MVTMRTPLDKVATEVSASRPVGSFAGGCIRRLSAGTGTALVDTPFEVASELG